MHEKISSHMIKTQLGFAIMKKIYTSKESNLNEILMALNINKQKWQNKCRGDFTSAVMDEIINLIQNEYIYISEEKEVDMSGYEYNKYKVEFSKMLLYLSNFFKLKDFFGVEDGEEDFIKNESNILSAEQLAYLKDHNYSRPFDFNELEFEEEKEDSISNNGPFNESSNKNFDDTDDFHDLEIQGKTMDELSTYEWIYEDFNNSLDEFVNIQIKFLICKMFKKEKDNKIFTGSDIISNLQVNRKNLNKFESFNDEEFKDLIKNIIFELSVTKHILEINDPKFSTEFDDIEFKGSLLVNTFVKNYAFEIIDIINMHKDYEDILWDPIEDQILLDEEIVYISEDYLNEYISYQEEDKNELLDYQIKFLICKQLIGRNIITLEEIIEYIKENEEKYLEEYEMDFEELVKNILIEIIYEDKTIIRDGISDYYYKSKVFYPYISEYVFNIIELIGMENDGPEAFEYNKENGKVILNKEQIDFINEKYRDSYSEDIIKKDPDLLIKQLKYIICYILYENIEDIEDIITYEEIYEALGDNIKLIDMQEDEFDIILSKTLNELIEQDKILKKEKRYVDDVYYICGDLEQKIEQLVRDIISDFNMILSPVGIEWSNYKGELILTIEQIEKVTEPLYDN